jgi:hypothetical protein
MCIYFYFCYQLDWKLLKDTIVFTLWQILCTFFLILYRNTAGYQHFNNKKPGKKSRKNDIGIVIYFLTSGVLISGVVVLVSVVVFAGSEFLTIGAILIILLSLCLNIIALSG